MRIIGLIFAFILILVFMGKTPFHMMEGFEMFGPFSMVVAIVALVMITGLFKEAIQQRQKSTASKKDLEEIKYHISQIEADIADIKEQIADYIIKTN